MSRVHLGYIYKIFNLWFFLNGVYKLSSFKTSIEQENQRKMVFILLGSVFKLTKLFIYTILLKAEMPFNWDRKKISTARSVLDVDTLSLFSRGSSHRTGSIKKLLLKISQSSQENACDGVFFYKKIQQRFFPVKIAKLEEKLFWKTSANGCFWKSEIILMLNGWAYFKYFIPLAAFTFHFWTDKKKFCHEFCRLKACN